MEARQSRWRSVAENPQPLVFAVCLIVLTALIGNELWASVSALMSRPALAVKTNTIDPSAQAFASQVTAANLFGRSANENNLPETGLQVTLRAVFAARDSRNASAVIETADGRAQVIRVGANVDGGALLHEVHENRVVLSRNGSLETLFFPAPQQSTEFAVAAASEPPAGATDNAEAVPPNALPANASPDEIKRAAILQRLEELRARSSR